MQDFQKNYYIDKIQTIVQTIMSNIKIRERMLLVYIVGGIIPILSVNLITSNSNKHAMIEQAKTAEQEELSLIGDSIKDSIDIVSDVSKQMYFDEQIENIACHEYENYEELLDDYRKFKTIPNYLNYYYRDISSISMYVNNPTISDSEYFIYANADIQSQDWYVNARAQKGNAYWFYMYDKLKRKNSICMARVMYTKDQREVGVLKITMQNNRTSLVVSQRNTNTAIIYNGEEILQSNFDTNDGGELMRIVLENADSDHFCKKLVYNDEKCLVTGQKIEPAFTKNYYLLVSIKPYKEIVDDANRTTLVSMVPTLICAVITIILIYVFSNIMSSSINRFRLEMHRASKGDFDIASHLGGKDEISELYEDLNVMVASIQELMAKIVKEKVQKEQINSRQKEVEFKMLASQINPHFLYNTLETIRMKARINGQPDIEELAKMLAKIMRRNIQVGEAPQTLLSELKLVEYYLKIQSYRFQDRISSEVVFNRDEVAGLYIMPLIIQPFVENAFVHGLEGMERGELKVEVCITDLLYITVKDNGCGMSPEKLQEVEYNLNDFENLDRTHIGICNVNQRIKFKYGENYGVRFKSREGEGTCVTIELPIITAL